jgi:hypothetical protein
VLLEVQRALLEGGGGFYAEKSLGIIGQWQIDQVIRNRPIIFMMLPWKNHLYLRA